jgi:hypothetical protein
MSEIGSRPSRLCVEFGWARVGEVTGSTDLGRWPLAFPELRPTPGVYRLLLSGRSGSEVYIGESDDVRRRGRQYRRGDETQKTSRRVHEHLLARLADGWTVQMEIVTVARYSLGRGPWFDTDLRLPEHRLLIENAALAQAFAAATEGAAAARVLNRITDRRGGEPG